MSGVIHEELSSWSDFKVRLDRYMNLSAQRRSQLVFRGQGDSTWSLQTTLDRGRQFFTSDDRENMLRRLLLAFRNETAGLTFDLGLPQDESEWELLARHHGLPTPFLDWSRSPYMAAYFAFTDESALRSEKVSVWVLDLDVFIRKDDMNLRLIGDIEAIRINRRAIQQRAVFLRVGWLSDVLEKELQKFLFRYDIPSTERKVALSELDEMAINARSLFLNLDSAAETAAWRVLEAEGD